MKKIAFIGLGVMGYPMAGHLANKGHELIVVNRSPAKVESWCQHYEGKSTDDITKDLSDIDILITCLTDDASLETVFYQQSLLDQLPKGALVVDHTSCTATIAERLYQDCQSRGLHFLDAPVTGGELGAVNGTLSIMVGGDEEAFYTAKPLLECYASNMNYVGSAGAGQRCKMVNQLCVAGVLQGLSEGLALAKKVGLSAETILASIGQGAASSWQMQQRTKTMMDDRFDFGFAIDLMRKDLGICLDEAAQHGLDLPLAKQVDARYEELQKQGYQRSDTSILIKQFES
ncbi:MAG: NAD(P)-dependent oxidoreductase [Thiotrichaceae bacterium]|nr:NAD(P)-dependent oxidoreductase [Thiotrichaceae bacterium]